MGKVKSGLLSVVLATLLVGASAVPAGAIALADLSVVVGASASEVSPPGGTVVYTVTGHNAGPTLSPVVLTFESKGPGKFSLAGSTIPSGCTAPANNTAEPAFNCNVTLNSGQSVVLTVAVVTTAAGDLVNTGRIQVAPQAINEIADDNQGNNTSAVTTSVTSPVDLAVSALDSPDNVSPPGGNVLYRVRVSNNGPGASPAELTNQTVGGSYVPGSSIVPAGCSAPAAGTPDPLITCNIGPLLAGEFVDVFVAIKTPTVTGVVKNISDVAVPASAVNVVDTNSANNHFEVTTNVLFDPTKSTALLRLGEKLVFQKSSVTVTESVNGIETALSVAPGGGSTCGTTLCGDGLRLEFGLDPNYQGLLRADVIFGKGDPCRGLGEGAGCTGLYERVNGVVNQVPLCGGGVLPCIEATLKDGAGFHWIVRMHSTDPDLLPPIKSPTGSQG